jgi:hypothetical protein
VHVSIQKGQSGKLFATLLALMRHDSVLFHLVIAQVVFAHVGGVAKIALKVKLALEQFEVAQQTFLGLEFLAADVTVEGDVVGLGVMCEDVSIEVILLRRGSLVAKFALEHAFLGVNVFDVPLQ